MHQQQQNGGHHPDCYAGEAEVFCPLLALDSSPDMTTPTQSHSRAEQPSLTFVTVFSEAGCERKQGEGEEKKRESRKK